MEIKFLDASQVVDMHDDQIAQTGGASGGGHRGSSYQGVQAAIEAVQNSYYDSLPELAAAYAVYIVQGHVFMDGNKRTGAAAMTTFLAGHDIEVTSSPEEILDMMVVLQERAESGERTGDLIAWLAERICS